MKFKYLSNKIEYEDWMLEDYKQTENPLPYNNLPDGEYLIRGTSKGQRKEYWKVFDKWYLISDVKRDNGHYFVDSCIFQLFPNLPEKEWDKIRAVGFERLNQVWRRHLAGHEIWVDSRKMIRGIQLDYIKFPVG